MRMTTAAILMLSTIAGAQPLPAQLRQAAEKSSAAQLNGAEAGIVQLSGRTRVTSNRRVAVGSLLALAGGLTSLYAALQCGVAGPDADRYDPPIEASYDTSVGECVLDGRPDPVAPRVWAERDPDPRLLYGGAGAAVLGLLLATRWSEVNAIDAVALRPRPDGGVEVSTRINVW